MSAAGIEEDLLRRDFSINAMAMTLAPGAFGRLLDPCGGERDVLARQLRVLHPLSFVEDPTRVFRAARYAARLGLVLHRDSRRALGLALEAAPYPALSGQRLFAEIEHLTAETAGWAGLTLLLRWQAFRLWDRGYRHDSAGSRRLREARRLAGWVEARDVDIDRIDLALIALLMDQRGAIRRRSLGRLCVTGARLARLARALSTARTLARGLAVRRRERKSRLAARLRARPTAELAAAWLAGGPRARRRVEWFLAEGRTEHPLLSGAGLLALGVARGPRVGEYLARLRDLRLDGKLRTAADERSLVKRWLDDERGGAR